MPRGRLHKQELWPWEVFSSKSHCLFSLHISTFTLTFCSVVEFSSFSYILFLRSKDLFSGLPFFVIFVTLILIHLTVFLIHLSQLQLFLNIYKSYSHISIYLCLYLFSLFFLTLFSIPSFSLLSPFPLFPTLFLFSPCKLNCWDFVATLPSWHSAQAQFSRLSTN